MSEQKKLYRLGDVNLYIGLRIEDKKVKTTFTPFIYNKSKSKVKLLSSDAETTILDLPECQEFKKDAYSSTKHAFQKNIIT